MISCEYDDCMHGSCPSCKRAKASSDNKGKRKFQPARRTPNPRFKTTTSTNFTLDNIAIKFLEEMCANDNLNRSRFLSKLLIEEAERRGYIGTVLSLEG